MTEHKPEPVAWMYTDEQGGRLPCIAQLTLLFDGWTETPLYPASALDEAYRRGLSDADDARIREIEGDRR